MAVSKAQIGARVDGTGAVFVNDIQVVGEQQAVIAALTDSTTGTASDTLNDTTASVKDDIASLAAKVNAILTALKAHGLVASA